MSFNSDIQKSSVQGFITLYELDARKHGGNVYRFHGHNDGVITWQGKRFTPIAITSDGLEVRGDGRASTPNLVIANVIDGVQGAISLLCHRYHDFAGCKLTVIHTLAKYLNSQDEQNYKKQLWYIEQKISDKPTQVTFELSNPVDFGNDRIPLRQVSNYCEWATKGRYRGEECGYTGTARFTIDGEPTTDPSLDRCGGCIADCQKRFGENSELPFGGQPAAGLL